MNSKFPLFYSITLVFFLSIITYYILKQIINTQRLEKKIFKLQESVKQTDSFYEDYYQLGQLYLKKKLFRKAIMIFRKALQLWDLNDEIGLGSVYNAIGFTFFSLEEYDYAIYYYDIALKTIPDYSLSRINLGYSYEKLNLLKEAQNCYQTALSWDPNNQLANNRCFELNKKISRLTTNFS